VVENMGMDQTRWLPKNLGRGQTLDDRQSPGLPVFLRFIHFYLSVAMVSWLPYAYIQLRKCKHH